MSLRGVLDDAVGQLVQVGHGGIIARYSATMVGHRIGSMRDSPSYVPATWYSRSPVLKWLAKKPSRVVAYFCISPVVPLGILAYSAATGDTLWLVLGTIGSLLLAIEAAVYLPRALRASRLAGPN